MADDIAKIGIAVDTAGLKQGEQALNQFNQAQKNVSQGAQQLNNAQNSTVNSSKQAADAQTKLGAATTATAKSYSLFQTALNGIGSLFGAHNAGANSATAAANGLSEAHGKASAATRVFRESVHALDPILIQAGGSMGALAPLAMSARAGMLGLATAITGSVVVALENAADASDKAKGRLQAFLGQQQGNAAFAYLKSGAASARTTVEDLSSAIEGLIKEQQSIEYTSGFRAPPGQANPFGLDPKQVTASATALSQAFQMDRETATNAGAAIKALFDGMGKLDTATQATTGLTRDLFDAMRDQSPTAAAAIAKAFGFDGPAAIEQFRAQLSQAAISVPEFIRIVARIGPETNASYQEFMKNNETVAQGFDGLKSAARNLMTEMGQTEGITAARKAMDGLTQALKAGGDSASTTLDVLKGFGTLALGALFGPGAGIAAGVLLFRDSLESLAQTAGASQGTLTALDETLKGLAVVALTLANPFAGIIAGLVLFQSEILTTIDKIKQLISWESQVGGQNTVAGTAGGAAAGALAGGAYGAVLGAGIGSAVPIVGTAIGAVTGGLIGAGIGAIGGGALGGGLGYTVDQIGNGASYTLDNSSTDNLPQFASGGLSTVAGSGGTDSQLVQFLATPGEVVAVGHPGATASTTATSTANNAADQIVTSITGSKLSVTDAINQMNNSVSQLLSKISTQQQSAASGVPSATSDMGYRSDTSAAKALSSGGGGRFINGGNAVPWAWDQIHAAQAKQDNISFNAAWAPDLQQQAADQAAYYAQYGAQQYVAMPPGSSTGGGGNFASYSAPGVGDYAVPNGSVFPPSSGYTDTGGYDSGTYSPFSNSAYVNDAFNADSYGNSSYYGAYATGGSFTVGSNNRMGGVDSQLISLHATPGEKVSVSNPDQSIVPTKTIGSGGGVVKFEMVQSSTGAPRFIASRSQLRRASK